MAYKPIEALAPSGLGRAGVRAHIKKNKKWSTLGTTGLRAQNPKETIFWALTSLESFFKAENPNDTVVRAQKTKAGLGRPNPKARGFRAHNQ